jgi:hypothetical protein
MLHVSLAQPHLPHERPRQQRLAAGPLHERRGRDGARHVGGAHGRGGQRVAAHARLKGAGIGQGSVEVGG